MLLNAHTHLHIFIYVCTIYPITRKFTHISIQRIYDYIFRGEEINLFIDSLYADWKLMYGDKPIYGYCNATKPCICKLISYQQLVVRQPV